MEQLQVPQGFRFCHYEPIVPRIPAMRVIVVNDLIQEPEHFSDVARRAPDFDETRWLKFERRIAGMALANIEGNVRSLVKKPEITRLHFSELTPALMSRLDPDALILSGTLRDFDFYHPALIAGFNEFLHANTVPVLAICGGHQLVGQAWGATITTIDGKPPWAKRGNRLVEYQYRFVKITAPADPIFAGIDIHTEARWQKYTHRRHLLRVWQNHGLEVDRLPEGFTQLARGYLSEQQMFVRRTPEQLIYGVQFHIEKSFQDWQLDNYWEHRNESRDGRFIFENFLHEALRFSEAARMRTGRVRVSETFAALLRAQRKTDSPQTHEGGGNLTGF
ncbi:MAG: type 1 glutamine amidotransferase [Blastocatellia bacterium]